MARGDKKMDKSIKILAMSVVASMFFVGCGGGGSSSTNTSDVTPPSIGNITGKFIDSEVQGLNYKCGDKSGTTNTKGEFTCTTLSDVSFFLGTYPIGTAKAVARITPETLYPTNSQAVTNILRLLQTLDKDGDPSNGITLDQDKVKLLKANSTSITSKTSAEFDNISSVIGKSLVSEQDAQDHFATRNFTQAYLDKVVFYKTGSYPQYKNKYRNGKIYFAGDNGNKGWDSAFDGASSTYSLVNGILKASFDDEGKVDFEIIKTNGNSSITVKATKGNESGIKHWYLSKAEAIKNTITSQYGFGQNTLKDETYYIPYKGKIVTFKLKNKFEFVDGHKQPFEILANGILRVDESGIDGKTDSSDDRYQYYKVTATDEDKITTCSGDSEAGVKDSSCHDGTMIKLYFSKEKAKSGL